MPIAISGTILRTVAMIWTPPTAPGRTRLTAAGSHISTSDIASTHPDPLTPSSAMRYPAPATEIVA